MTGSIYRGSPVEGHLPKSELRVSAGSIAGNDTESRGGTMVRTFPCISITLTIRRTATRACLFLGIGLILLLPTITLARDYEPVRTGTVTGKVYQAYMGTVLD